MPCNKGKIWYNIPRTGSKHKGGWVYHGYTTNQVDLVNELYDLRQKEYNTKWKHMKRPDRFDIYYKKKSLSKSKSKFIE